MPGRSFTIELTDGETPRLQGLAAHLDMTPDELLADIVRTGIDLREQERAFDERRWKEHGDRPPGELDDGIPY